MNPSQQGRLTRLRVAGVKGQCESLVLSLQAVLRAYGRDVEYDELAAVTGAAFMSTWAPDVPDPSWWPVFGRDAFLKVSAQAYGLSLRELHPPAAVPRPVTPREFDLHFRDSYQPFIRTAIDRHEPVIAWMGWPKPHEMLWGVITDIDPTSGRCIGRCCGQPDERITLSGTPVHVYLVQEYAETQPRPVDLLSAAMDRAAIVLNDRLDTGYGVTCGPTALEHWRDTLDADTAPGAPAAAPGRNGAPHEYHARLARFLVCNRRAAMRFFDRFRAHADAAQAERIDECAAAFHEIIARMEPACDPGQVRVRLQSDKDRRDLIDALTQAIEFERRAASITTR